MSVLVTNRSQTRSHRWAQGTSRYIVDTTHPDSPASAGSKNPDGSWSSSLEDDVKSTINKCRFEKLKVLAAEPGSHDNEAFVTFKAWFRVSHAASIVSL